MTQGQATHPGQSYILSFKCPDRLGVVARYSGLFLECGAFITEVSNYTDPVTEMFFLRCVFDDRVLNVSMAEFRRRIATLARELQMEYSLRAMDDKPRVLLAVSRYDHCLSTLLTKWRSGALPANIVAVVSNHEDCRGLVQWYGLPYYHLPVSAATRAAQEAQILSVIAEHGAEVLVLARYMQILSPELCKAYPGRIINIHHSFLPSFVGAKPYHQAWAKGVKLIGATCHYVTAELDQGPIIEQDVIRIDHSDAVEDMVRYGKDIEKAVLARGLRYHLEDRVLVHGNKTVVFR